MPIKLIKNYKNKNSRNGSLMAGTTGVEPATSSVTGMRSNQLIYAPSSRVPGVGIEPTTYGL